MKRTAGYNCKRGRTALIWIYKATEAHAGPIFRKIAGRIKPLRPETPLMNLLAIAPVAQQPALRHHAAQVYHDQQCYYAYGPSSEDTGLIFF
jgi:hypothetical protein